jgi:hypothetical protein
MDDRASVASLLLSIVVAMPCARKVICVPSDSDLPMPASAAPPVAAPTSKPAATRAPEKMPKGGHCTVHAGTFTGQRTLEHTVEHTL